MDERLLPAVVFVEEDEDIGMDLPPPQSPGEGMDREGIADGEAHPVLKVLEIYTPAEGEIPDQVDPGPRIVQDAPEPDGEDLRETQE